MNGKHTIYRLTEFSLAAYGRVYKIVSKGSSIKSASEFIEKGKYYCI